MITKTTQLPIRERICIPEYLEGAFKITQDIIDDGAMNNRYFTPRIAYMNGVAFKMLGADEVSPEDPVYADAIREFEKLPHVEFRIRDDDGEIYHYGEMLDYRDHPSGEWEFAPLDSFGNAYGCTSLEYKDKHGKWNYL